MSAGARRFVYSLLGIAISVAAYLVPHIDDSARVGLATLGGSLLGKGSLRMPGDQRAPKPAAPP